MALTYNDLLTRAPEWLYAQNTSLVAAMPTIIEEAEDQIYLRFDHDLFQTVLTGKSLAAGATDLDISADNVLEVRAVRLKYRSSSQWTPMQRRDLEMLSMLYSTNRPDRPRFYAEYGSQDVLRLFPTPRADIDIEITANVAPDKLGVSNQTNIITEKYPRVLEKAVFRQAALYMKQPDSAATYEKEMTDALTEANAQIARRRRDEAGTQPVTTSNSGGMP